MTVSLIKPAAVTLTNEDVAFIFAVRDAVIERGADYVYDQGETFYPDGRQPYYTDCTYVNYNANRSRPSCLVGQGLFGSGLATLTTLEAHEGTNASTVMGRIAPRTTTPLVREFAETIQTKQDSGKTWGEAYALGLDFLAEAGTRIEAFVL
jgi:hypothetical protein